MDIDATETLVFIFDRNFNLASLDVWLGVVVGKFVAFTRV